MTVKLKLFKDLTDQITTEDSISTINIITTNEIDQAFITNVKVEANDPLYPCNLSLVLNGSVLITENSTNHNTILETTGKQLIDISSSLDIVIDTGDNYYSTNIESSTTPIFQTRMNALSFDQSSIYSIKDLSTDDRTTISAIPYTTITPNITSSLLNSGLYSASSAFGWIDKTISKDTEKIIKYSRIYNGVIYTHDSTGTLIQTSEAIPEGTYGACTDGTYFYGKGVSNNNILYRLNVSDGSLASSIIMDQGFQGQNSNQGSYTLYHDGFVYSRLYGSFTIVYKVNVVTGEVTTLTVVSGGSYSAGGIITVAANGIPYLVEHCSGRTIVIDLSTFTVVPETWSTTDYLNVSTEYGNNAIEVSAGVVAFFYKSVHLFFDTNTMTKSSGISNTASNFPSTFGTWTSIANLPLYEFKTYTREIVPREIAYSLYAGGVEIINT